MSGARTKIHSNQPVVAYSKTRVTISASRSRHGQRHRDYATHREGKIGGVRERIALQRAAVAGQQMLPLLLRIARYTWQANANTRSLGSTAPCG